MDSFEIPARPPRETATVSENSRKVCTSRRLVARRFAVTSRSLSEAEVTFAPGGHFLAEGKRGGHESRSRKVTKSAGGIKYAFEAFVLYLTLLYISLSRPFVAGSSQILAEIRLENKIIIFDRLSPSITVVFLYEVTRRLPYLYERTRSAHSPYERVEIGRNAVSTKERGKKERKFTNPEERDRDLCRLIGDVESVKTIRLPGGGNVASRTKARRVFVTQPEARECAFMSNVGRAPLRDIGGPVIRIPRLITGDLRPASDGGSASAPPPQDGTPYAKAREIPRLITERARGAA